MGYELLYSLPSESFFFLIRFEKKVTRFREVVKRLKNIRLYILNVVVS